ncbi:MAG: lysophospholipid acyltransferase family protein [Acidaminococcales bacterium]|jgi:KDO2-lipid IV(A) lauroyltransferase|nr:lysophospholipid acyltransferase family protein [Acidaminococcales bacterium]
MWQYYMMKAISKLACLLPDKARRLAGAALGRVFWLGVPRWRKCLAAAQARMCLGISDPEARAVVKGSVLKYGDMIMEVLSFPALSKDNIRAKVALADEGRFQEIIAHPKGFVLATAHFGNWELLGAAMSLYGCRLVAVAQKQHNSAMDRFINEYRALVGEHVTYRTGVLEMARMLEKGFAIGLLADQDGGKGGVKVGFFGRESSCPQGPAALSRLKKVPLYLMLLRQREDGKHEIFVKGPIEGENTGDRETDIKNTTAALMAMLEEEIRKDPAMWFWLHDRWKVKKHFHKLN